MYRTDIQVVYSIYSYMNRLVEVCTVQQLPTNCWLTLKCGVLYTQNPVVIQVVLLVVLPRAAHRRPDRQHTTLHLPSLY